MHAIDPDTPEGKDTILAQWDRIYQWTRTHKNWRLSELSLLIDEIRKQPDYLRYYIYTSHFTLCFCLSHRVPFQVRARVEAAGAGRFQVYGNTVAPGQDPRRADCRFVSIGEGNEVFAAEIVMVALRHSG